MRRFIFILMIALLPLRGWMGEAMATTMAVTEITINFIAPQSINTPPTAELPLKNDMSDCEMHKTGTQDDTNEKSSCSACQACHSVGTLTSSVHVNSIDKTPYALPLTLASQFISANLALFQKPPIL